MTDDDDDAPTWLSIAWNTQVEIENLLKNPNRAIRIATIRPSRYAVIDRIVWKNKLGSGFELFYMPPPVSEVPQGWRFCFPVGAAIGYQAVSALRNCKWAKILKIQVLELGDHIAEARQVIFDPESCKLVKEFLLT